MDEKTSLLKDEYLLIMRFYEDLDARLITIKGWSSTVAIAAIGFGVQYGKPLLWLFASAASLVFWVLESIWKSFQYAYRYRIEAIETAFREQTLDSIQPFQAYMSWYVGWKKTKFLRIIVTPYVAFPHIVTAIVGGLLFFFRDRL